MVFLLGIVTIVAAVVGGYFVNLSPNSVPPQDEWVEAPDPEPVSQAQLRVVKIQGAVEVRVADGSWQAAPIGTQLQAGMDLRAPAAGSASLDYGGVGTVEVNGDSRMKVNAIRGDVLQVEAGEGLVIVDVERDSGKRIEVTSPNSDVLASTVDGRLHVLTDGQGTVQAAVTRGEASLSAQGEKVTIAAGFQSIVYPGEAPTSRRRSPIPCCSRCVGHRNPPPRNVCTALSGRRILNSYPCGASDRHRGQKRPFCQHRQTARGKEPHCSVCPRRRRTYRQGFVTDFGARYQSALSTSSRLIRICGRSTKRHQRHLKAYERPLMG
ncbi:MAG: hypothetical protein R3C68_11685 [Myxococcota bacterium]